MINKSGFNHVLLGAFLLIAAATGTRADITIFTNRLSWEAAAGGGTGDITDNMNSGTLDRGSYVISGSAPNAFPNSNAQTTIDGSGYLRVLLESSLANDALFTFRVAVTAMGYDVNPQSFNLGATVNVSIDGTAAGSYTLPSTDVNGFIGIVSDTPFTTIDITTPDADAWHGIQCARAIHHHSYRGWHAGNRASGSPPV